MAGAAAGRVALACLPLAYLIALLPLIKDAPGSPNDESRFGAALALAATGAYGLAPPYAGTLDRALRDDGVFISDKPPLLNVLAAGAIRLHAMMPADAAGLSAYRFVTLLLAALPAALTLAFTTLLMRRSGVATPAVLLSGVLLAVTTLLTPYAVTFSNHPLTAALAVALLMLLRRVESDGGAPAALGAGFIAGALHLLDVPVGLTLMLVTLIWIAWRRPRALVPAAIGLLPPLGFGLWLNHLLTHRWLPTYFHGDMYDYPGSVWTQASPDYAGSYPLRAIQRLIACTVGSQGIALFWPLGLLALFGLLRALRSRARGAERPLALWVLAAWAAVMAAVISNPSARGSDLGGGYGLRWVIPLMAPLMLFFPHALAHTVGRALWLPAALWGLLIVAIGVWDPWPASTISRFPPLHNVAVLLAQRDCLPPRAGDAVIRWTAREPALGHFDLGMVHFHRGDHSSAAREFRRALDADRPDLRRQFDPTLARYHLGISLTELGLYAAADEVYRSLLEAAPNNIGARNNWARALLRWGRPAEALAQVQESLRRDPGNLSAQRLFADIHGALGGLASPEGQP